MTENDIDPALSAKVKAYASGYRLPDGFAERLQVSVRRSQLRFRIRLLALAALVAAASALTVGLMGRTAPRDAGCASIIATQGHRGEEKISGWMLLSVFRDIFRRNKANKRKEEE